MAELYQKIGTSNLIRTWANDPPPNAVTAPYDAKFASGWAGLDTPPADWLNYIYKEFGEKINHLLQHGVARWNNATAYASGDVVTHSGSVWVALLTNTNSTPATLNTNWVKLQAESSIPLGKTINGSFNASHGADVALNTTATAIPFDTNDYTSVGSITHSTTTNNSRFTVNAAGVYEFVFQPQVATLSNITSGVYFWIRKNGVNVANSSIKYQATTSGSTATPVLSVILPLATNDYIEMFGQASANNEYSLDFIAGNATRPATPAVIVSVKGWA